MTFTVIARDPADDAVGICLATSPFGVASRCPHILGGVGAISSQCHSNPWLGRIGLSLLGDGVAPARALEILRAYDENFEYRQVGLMTPGGALAVHSGRHGKDYTGHMTGENFIVMGNGLKDRGVVEAMHAAYLGASGESFEERLMQTVEAGFRAGGEPIGQRSAGMLVAAPDRHPRVRLQVDAVPILPEDGGDAVLELRRVFDIYKPLIPYYSDFWPDHPQVQWKDWLKDLDTAS